jgi:hypothetical protein
MTISDFVMLALGEIILCGAFAVGVGVGMSLMRKELQDDNGDEE